MYSYMCMREVHLTGQAFYVPLSLTKVEKFSKSNEYYMHAWTHAYY